MKPSTLVLLLLLPAASAHAADPILIRLGERDSAVVLLDRAKAASDSTAATPDPATPMRDRPEAIVPATESPGRVIVERVKNPDPNDWTAVRWVLRFPLKDAPRQIKQARLHLWCQGSSGEPTVSPQIELIASGDKAGIVIADRTSKPLLAQKLEIPFPAAPGLVELDVTAMVREAIKQGLKFVTFRVSAASDEVFSQAAPPQNFYFAGYSNVWSWDRFEPPLLELVP